MAALVETRNLRFSYRAGEEILKGLSFAIHKGEMVAVTGPSGSGKSTLFYLLGCLMDRYQGEIIYQGHTLQKLNALEKSWMRNQEIGFVFQQFHLLPRASVLENILLPTYYPFDHSKPTADDIARAKNLMERLGIAELAERGPQELSGGQQQRVAIARALLRDPPFILADEPTGNLDSKSSAAVMDILAELHREGRTVIVITHSSDIANRCSRIIKLRDGVIETDQQLSMGQATELLPKSQRHAPNPLKSLMARLSPMAILRSLPIAWDNILRSKTKSLLTMLGVSLGVAAVLSTMSLGSFAKRKILAGYEVLGVNTLRFSGYPNWRPSKVFSPASFREFTWESDIVPLFRIFPDIVAASPLYELWKPTLSYAGQSFADDTMAVGVNPQLFGITSQNVAEGRALSLFDVENAAGVCVVGSDVRDRLFLGAQALGQTISVGVDSQASMPCRIIGILERQPSAQGPVQPNAVVLMPYTYFSKSAANPWDREMHQFIIKIKSGVDPADVGPSLEGFFRTRYGDTGNFSAASDAKLVSQMKLFLNVFSSLLTAVALIALLVGGVGINNMMLANLSERLKELGLRKALGATPHQLRLLVLGESMLLCLAAGLLGLGGGFAAYQGLAFAATRLIPKLEYEWIFEPLAFVISFVAILVTGVASGLMPALKAERLDVMEAMRQDA